MRKEQAMEVKATEMRIQVLENLQEAIKNKAKAPQHFIDEANNLV